MKSKPEEVPVLQDEEEDYSDSYTPEAAPAGQKQPPLQSGEKITLFQPSEKKGIEGVGIGSKEITLEDKLRMGVSSEELEKKYFLSSCDGYTSFHSYSAYKNSSGDIFLFEKKKEKDQDVYLLRFHVNNRTRR